MVITPSFLHAEPAGVSLRPCFLLVTIFPLSYNLLSTNGSRPALTVKGPVVSTEAQGSPDSLSTCCAVLCCAVPCGVGGVGWEGRGGRGRGKAFLLKEDLQESIWISLSWWEVKAPRLGVGVKLFIFFTSPSPPCHTPGATSHPRPVSPS